MHLHEAVQSRTVEKPFIARRSWRDELAPCFFTDVKLLPTDSPDCCILQSRISRKGPCRGWQPTAEDLTADDWEAVP